MNPTGRHVFWTSPRTVGPVFRALPMLSGGRPVTMGGFFMGDQAPAPATGLDGLTIAAIQNRVVASPAMAQFSAEMATVADAHRFRGAGPVPAPWDKILHGRPPGVPQLTPAEMATIQALAQDPSSEVLDELSLIDGFFGVVAAPAGFQREYALTRQVCGSANGRSGFGRAGQALSLAQAIVMWAGYRPAGRSWGVRREGPAPSELLEAVRSNPFYCGRPREFPEVVYGLDPIDYAGWFGIDPNQTWGQVKQQVYNAVAFMGVAAGYPFPPPIDMDKAAPFWILSIGDIREIVKTPEPIDPDAVRCWITLQVLANYAAWVEQIEANQKKKAKKARRKAIMTMVALAVASIAAAFLLPAIIALTVSAIKTAVTVYVDAEKRKKAAHDMANAAKMFEADAPAFSQEVDKTAKLLDEQAAKQAAEAPPSPELQAAIKEVEDETGPGIGTILPVGGGIAAASIAALLIFK
jgi:hypothetical protein